MNGDGNLAAINDELVEIAKRETSYELMLDAIDDELVEIYDLMKTVIKKASNYDGYDFEAEAIEAIKDLIWETLSLESGVL